MQLEFFRKTRLVNLIVCLAFCLNMGFSGSALAFGKVEKTTELVSMLRQRAASDGLGNAVVSLGIESLKKTLEKEGPRGVKRVLADKALDGRSDPLEEAFLSNSIGVLQIGEENYIVCLIGNGWSVDLSQDRIKVVPFASVGQRDAFISRGQLTWLAGKYTPTELIDAQHETKMYLQEAGEDKRIFSSDDLVRQAAEYSAQRTKRQLPLLNNKEQAELVRRLQAAFAFHNSAIIFLTQEDINAMAVFGFSPEEVKLDLKSRVRCAIVLDPENNPSFFHAGEVGSPEELAVTASSGGFKYEGYDFEEAGGRAPRSIYPPLAMVESYMQMAKTDPDALRAYRLKLLHEYFEVSADSKSHRQENIEITSLINKYDRVALDMWKEREAKKAQEQLAREAEQTIAEAVMVSLGDFLKDGVIQKELIDEANAQLEKLVESGLFTGFRVMVEGGKFAIFTTRSQSKAVEDTPKVYPAIVDVYLKVLAKAGVDLTGKTYREQVDALKIQAIPSLTYKEKEPRQWAKLIFRGFPFVTLDDVGDVNGKAVGVRFDLNVPVEYGHIKNRIDPHLRFIEAAVTAKESADKGAKVVVWIHQGRLNEADFMAVGEEHAELLSKATGHKVKYVDDLFGPKAIEAIQELKAGEILMLKPVRAEDPTNPGKMLEDNSYFISTLRKYIDLYVFDGFPVAHRSSPSVTGPEGIPSVAGRAFEKDYLTILKWLNPPKPHIGFVGGGKTPEKNDEVIFDIESGIAEAVCTGGNPASIALIAAQIASKPEAERAKLTDAQLYEIAVSTVGLATAETLKEELPETRRIADLMVRYPGKIKVPVDMVYLDENNKRNEVKLVNGKVPEGFNYLLKGIGPETAKDYAAFVSRTEKPFASASIIGPLSDSRFPDLDPEVKIVIDAVSRLKAWLVSGGDSYDYYVKHFGYHPTDIITAGGAAVEFRKKSDALDAIAFLKRNRPDVLRDKKFVPTNYGDAHTLAHTLALGPIAKAFKEAGGRIFVRTHTFIDGGRTDAARFAKTQMPIAVEESLRQSLGEDITNVVAGLESIDIDTINPRIHFSISNIYTQDNRPINVSRLRQALKEDENVALILIPGEVDKKGRMGTPGDIDSKKITDKLEIILNQALRERGIDPNVIKYAEPKPLPAVVQVSKSDIDSLIKLAVLMPVPGSEVYRLMQLAQDAGINLKELLEKTLSLEKAMKPEEFKAEAEMAQKPLLGEAPVLPEIVKKEKEALKPEPSPLADLSLAGVKINDALQTIFLDRPNVQGVEVSQGLETIKQRLIKSQKMIRIVAPANSETEQTISKALLQRETKGLTVASHPILRNGHNYTAFIIRPTKNVVIVGAGNEGIKIAPLFKAAAYGTPTVAIHSLMRSERVLHFFKMGYNVVFTDVSKDKSGTKVVKSENDINKIKEDLIKLLSQSYTADIKNELLNQLPETERLKAAEDKEIFRKASYLGYRKAEEIFDKQYKGLLSERLNAGEYDLIVDASPEGSGADNRALLYDPAIRANPNKKIVVLYQGGEKEKVAEASFCTVSSMFEDVEDLNHLRHVSCNTTGLSSIVAPILEELGAYIDLDNNAFRRGPDPGDLKDGTAGIIIQTKYHHLPDLLSVINKPLKSLIRGNTDASQIGTNTRFHFHMLYLRRRDGKPFDKRLVERIQGVQSRVALVNFPGDTFDSIRLTELSHNLLPQQVSWAPDGANHLLVPALMIQETDDPAQLRLIYAVPQESIVAPGNIDLADALFGHASRDASMSIVNDLSGISQIVASIERSLPAKGLEEPEMAEITKIESSTVQAGDSVTVRLDVTLADESTKGHFVVPAGTSTGMYEAKTVGVERAKENLGKINAEVTKKGLRSDQLTEIAQIMLRMGKDELGAEATLSYQMAAAWAAARQKGLEPYEFIRQLAPDLASRGIPRTKIQYNITNGGEHAKNSLDLQEFMIVPTGKTTAESNKMCDEIDRQLGLIYQALGLKANPDDKGIGELRGKEGGYNIPNLTQDELAEIYANADTYQINNLDIRALRKQKIGIHEFVLNCMLAAIKNAGYEPSRFGEAGTVALALDAAATAMLVENESNIYHFEGSQISSKDLVKIYAEWVKKYPIVSIEDGLAENDSEGWLTLIGKIGDNVLVIGDDVFVTQAGRLLEFINSLKEKGFIDAEGKLTKKLGILIKLNQNGFLTTGINDPKEGYLGTLEVIRLAKQYGLEWIISHRSKEAGPKENEVSIAELAAGTDAYALKSGDHVQDIRAVKEDRLAAIDARERAKAVGAEAAAAAEITIPSEPVTPVIPMPTVAPSIPKNIVPLIGWWAQGDGFYNYESLLSLQGLVRNQLSEGVISAAKDTDHKKIILISSKVLRSDPSLILTQQSINEQINQNLGVFGSNANIEANAYKPLLVDEEQLFAEITKATNNSVLANKEIFAQIVTQADMYEGVISNPADLLKQLKRMGFSEETIVGFIGPKAWTEGLKQAGKQAGVPENAVMGIVEAGENEIALAGNVLEGVIEAAATADRRVPDALAQKLDLLIDETRIDIHHIQSKQKPISARVEDTINSYREQIEAATRV